MPVSGQHHPDEIQRLLGPWLADQIPDAANIEVSNVVVPQSSGFSNETFLFDAGWTGPDGPVEAQLVLRSQSITHVVFPEPDVIEQQYVTMKLLGDHTDVPVPRTRWSEPDPSLFGQPFFVMDRVVGRAPGDNPPYTAEGFVVDMTPAERRVWHHQGLSAMCAVHRVDWEAVGFQHLDRRGHGELGPEQRQGYLAHFLAWATGGEPHPVANRAWDWLVANWPDDGQHIELCWGDARPGNQLFRGTDVVAVLDWEMVSLGNSESDLGWWLFAQRYHTDGNGLPLLEGMMTSTQTVARWEHQVGRTAVNIDFYEILAGFQFTLAMIRLSDLLGIPGMDVDNPVIDLTAQLLEGRA